MAEKCPKCGAPLAEISETRTGRQLQKCSTAVWNSETKSNEGCDYVKWIVQEPETLDEKCPKCGSPVILTTTRFGKKMKKCSTNVWNAETKKAAGCDFVEWINGSTEQLDEDCPTCGNKLVLFTTNAGKKMKKCSTAGWDSQARKATGCPYMEWLRPGQTESYDGPKPKEEEIPFPTEPNF
jgi:ssDNA-binding Zn-finger/Zn-ribbon topoisomerase 1